MKYVVSVVVAAGLWLLAWQAGASIAGATAMTTVIVGGFALLVWRHEDRPLNERYLERRRPRRPYESPLPVSFGQGIRHQEQVAAQRAAQQAAYRASNRRRG